MQHTPAFRSLTSCVTMSMVPLHFQLPAAQAGERSGRRSGPLRAAALPPVGDGTFAIGRQIGPRGAASGPWEAPQTWAQLKQGAGPEAHRR